MIGEIGRSGYMTALQMYQFLNLAGIPIRRNILQRRIHKLVRLCLIRCYRLHAPNLSEALPVYALDLRGFQEAGRLGVRFHMGNRYISGTREYENGPESAEKIKRVPAGSMIVLGLLMNGCRMERFGVMETMRAREEDAVHRGAILRTSACVQVDADSLLLFEVTGRGQDSLEKPAEKTARCHLLADAMEREGQTVPQLVICGEDASHNRQIHRFLLARGLEGGKNTILYTEDLFYIFAGLTDLYTLDENDALQWYRLPGRNDSISCSA